MDGLRIILLCVAVLILLFNFFINSANIFKIVGFCFRTHSISQYWDLFYKNCVSGRAIISSIIGFLLALIIFIIIAPIVLIRGIGANKKMDELKKEGLVFQYQDKDLKGRNLMWKSNIGSVININLDDVKPVGSIAVDGVFVLGKLMKHGKAENIPVGCQAMHKIKLNNNMEAVVPMLLNINGQDYPAYYIYNEEHKRQYKTIENKLYNNGYKRCIYFSLIDI